MVAKLVHAGLWLFTAVVGIHALSDAVGLCLPHKAIGHCFNRSCLVACAALVKLNNRILPITDQLLEWCFQVGWREEHNKSFRLS